MQPCLIACCALVARCSFGSDWKAARAGEIFRYTVVGRSPPLDSITLGQPWKSAAKYGASERDTVNALPDGTFGGADAIGVHRDTNGIVTEVEFYYHARRDLNALVSDYRSSLGSPFAVTTDTLARAIRTTTRWKDENTEFVISTLNPPQKDGTGAVATLTDRSRPR
jgi:hypothetical protein